MSGEKDVYVAPSVKIMKIQTEIKKKLQSQNDNQWVENIQNSILNIKNNTNNEYLKLLNFVNNKISTETTGINLFMVDGCDDEDMEYMTLLHSQYNDKYKDTLDNFELFMGKSKFIDNKYDDMEDSDLKKVLKERILNLENCQSKSENYYNNEYKIENIKSKQLENDNINDEKYIINMAKSINWSPKYLEKKLLQLDDEKINEIIQFYKNNDNERKLLYTFMNLNFFDENTGDIKYDKFRTYLEKFKNTNYITKFINGNTLDKINKQLVLGRTIDIVKNKIKEYIMLYTIENISYFNLVDTCSKLTTWSLELNDLFVTIFSKVDNIFPVRMNLPSKSPYEFKSLDEFSEDELFKNSTFKGFIELNYVYSNNIKRKWLLFIFINKGLLSHNKRFSFIKASKLKYYVVGLDRKLIENIRLNYNRSVTYRELISLLNMKGITTYLYDIEEQYDILLFTRKNKDTNEQLNNIIKRLKLKKINKIEYIKNSQFKLIEEKLNGGGNYKIDLLLNQKFKEYDIEITGVYYSLFLNSLFNNNYIKNTIKYFNRSYYLYLYPFSGDLRFVSAGATNYKLMNKLINITKYKPFNSKFYNIMEIILKFKLNNNKSILNISPSPNFIEVFKYLNYKINNIKLIIDKDNITTKDIQDYEIYLDKFKKIYEIDIIFINNLYSYPYMTIEPRELVIYQLYYYNKSLEYIHEHYNIITIFVGLLCGLKFTTKGGNFILYMNAIINKAYADIYLIGKKYFTESYLYYPEVSNHIKRSGTVAIFKNFKGISNNDLSKLLKIFDKIKNLYPNLIEDFNINEVKLRKKYNINKPIKKIIKYINSFLNTSLDKDIKLYQEIIDFNNERYMKQALFMAKLSNLIDKSEKDLPKLPTPEQIHASIMYCKKWDIEYDENYIDNNINKQTGIYRKILEELYTYDRPIVLEFKTPYHTASKNIKYNTLRDKRFVSSFKKISKTKKSSRRVGTSRNSKRIDDFLGRSIKKQTLKSDKPYKNYLSIDNELFDDNNKMVQVGRYIDSRRDFTKSYDNQTQKYDRAKLKYRFYQTLNPVNKLTETVARKFSTGPISQAWLKMWEMLIKCNLISKNRKRFTTMHICEAPGMFIKAINHFVYTHTNIQEFSWHAQSLHPSLADIKDTYGLIKKYKNRWDWGADGTGDITKKENIIHYMEKYKNADLLTSDCGLPWGHPKYHHVAVSSLIALLLMTPVNSTFVYKILAPIDTPIVWNLVYIIYQSYQDMLFYKPLQNSHSREFYIIARKNIGLKDEVKDILLNILDQINDKFDDSIDYYDGLYPEPFIRQVSIFNNDISNNYANTIEKQIYYMEKDNILEDKFKNMANDVIKEKNNDWIRKYKLVSIDKKHNL
jgi:hypothetical protein